MKNVRKKLFAFSGLFMILAQIVVMAFGGIVAVAITQTENTKELFRLGESSAVMSYELTENETIKWTVNLKKEAGDSPTRFMVDLVADQELVLSEEVQSSNPEMSFERKMDDEYIKNGFSEVATGSRGGKTTITFETSRNITNLIATPKLVTVPTTNVAVAAAAVTTAESTDAVSDENQPVTVSEPVDLLGNTPAVTFEIPAVEVEEVVEESTPVVPEEPVAEKTVPTPEAPVADAGTADVANSEVVNESDQVGDDSLVEESIEPAQYQGFVSLTGAQLLADPLDPFKYHDSSNATGIYPKHETNEHSQSGSDIATSDNIRNYNYGLTTGKNDEVTIYDTVNKKDNPADGLNFQTGYHEYGTYDSEENHTGRINTKKTVMPTNDPNVFQVQLDTIGDAIRPFEKVDIVLVLDKSSSMNNDAVGGGTRWTQLKTAVKTFSEDILKENDIPGGAGRIQIGMVGFSSTVGTNTTTSIEADIASFTTLAENKVTKGFTNSSNDIISHPIYTSAPGRSGTPTFIGVDAGLNLLHDTIAGARNDAKKIMITITDGQPTYYPGGNYNLTNTTLSRPTQGSVDNLILRYTATNTWTNKSYGGNGGLKDSDVTDSKQPNIDFVNKKNSGKYNDYPDSYFYSVGFYTENNANDVLKALGREGAFPAKSINELVTALKQSVSHLVYTIANAEITDPMSDYVTLDQNSIKQHGLYLSNEGVLRTIPANSGFAKEIGVSWTDTQINVNNVSLGYDTSGRQGYRITYEVTLKEEWRDGKFYPADGTTYIANGERGNHYYAVPSVRVAPKDVSFKKTNTSDTLGGELKGAQFTLTAGDKTYTSNVTGEDGIVTFKGVLPGEYTLTEIVTPVGHKTMAPIQVKVDKEGAITKIEGEKESSLESVINELKQIDLELNKKGPDNEALIKAKFVLRKYTSVTEYEDSNFVENDGTPGLHQLSTVVPGEYKLVETEAPAGYQVLGEIGTVKIDKYGVVTFTKTGETQSKLLETREVDGTLQITLPTVTNKFRPFDLKILKVDDAANVLVGAEFTLTKDGDNTFEKVITSTTQVPLSEFKFTDLEPGTYYLEETIVPENHIGLSGKITIEITNMGIVKIDRTDVTPGWEKGADNNLIEYTVTNKKKIPLPSTGGSGTMFFVAIGVLGLLSTGLYFLQRKDQEVA